MNSITITMKDSCSRVSRFFNSFNFASILLYLSNINQYNYIMHCRYLQLQLGSAF